MVNDDVGYQNFRSQLLEVKKPLVSVIIPTLNRYSYLNDVLDDLQNQNYTNFEVIVVDQSDVFDETFYKNRKLNLQFYYQGEKALWQARNFAVSVSKGSYILLFDDDSRISSDWISNHLKCIDYFNVSISAGVTQTLIGGGLDNKAKYFHLGEVFDTGNAMVEKSVFKKVGMFDVQFERQRMGDAEFGLRSLLAGFRIISNPFASRVHLKVETGGLRQMGSWDAIRTDILFGPRPVPSVLYFIRSYYGNKVAVLYLIKHIPQSYVPYKQKSNKRVRFLYILLFPIFLPGALYSVISSWYLSSQMLKEGNLVPLLR